MGNFFDACREMICLALRAGQRSEIQSCSPGAGGGLERCLTNNQIFMLTYQKAAERTM